MRITDLLDKRSISLDAAPKSKEEALNDAVALMEAAGRLNDVEGYRRQVFAREEESTCPSSATSTAPSPAIDTRTLTAPIS